MNIFPTEENVPIIIAHNKHLLNAYSASDSALRDEHELACLFSQHPT